LIRSVDYFILFCKYILYTGFYIERLSLS